MSKQLFSRRKSSTRGGRAKFYEMLEFVKSQKHKTAIVVNCVDRLQRGYKECVELDELRKQGRIEIHFYKESFYLHKDSNSSDILRWDMGIMSAKMYVGSLRDNVIRSQEYKRENGQWQSCAPVGYLNISKTKTTPADLVIDEERAPKVKRLFEEYAKGGRTLQDITNLARTLGLNHLDEELKTLFCGYIQGKCDEKMYNELKTEIELEKEKLQKDMDKYLEIDNETDEMLANIAEIAANIGIFLKSPIVAQKREILRLILSDCKTEGKNIAFSIAKPFDELLKTPETDKWCTWPESNRHVLADNRF